MQGRAGCHGQVVEQDDVEPHVHVPLGARGRDAPVTRKPSGGVIAAAPMVLPGVDVFAIATSNVVELSFCTDDGVMLTV